MAAQEYYRSDYASRPLSPPTNALGDTSGNYDHYDTADVDERVPERVTSPSNAAKFDNDKLNTPPSPSHERNPSAFSDTPGYGRTDSDAYEEEGNNPYGKNYNMVNQDSKEALVPPVRDRRSSGYQDLGVFLCLCLIFSFPPTIILILGRFAEYAEANPVSQAAVPMMERGGKGKLARWIGVQPLEQRILDKQNGIGRQRRPYVGE